MRCAVTLAVLIGTGFLAGCGPTRNGPDRDAFDDGFQAFKDNQWQRAVVGFTRFLRSDPQNAARGEVYYYRGQALAHLGRRREAMDDFERTLGAKAPEPIRSFARVGIGNLYYEDGNDAGAVEAYGEALKGPQGDLPIDMILLRLGVSLQRMGRWQSADKYLKLLIERYPESVATVEARRRYGVDAFGVQTGAYTSLSAAQQEAQRIRAAGYAPRIGESRRPGQVLHTVQVGRASNYAEAQALARQVTAAGFSALIVP